MKKQLKSISEQTPYDVINSMNNCGMINSNIYEALITELQNGHVKLVRGVVSDGSNISNHIFVLCSLDETYVIDGALDQFCLANNAEGRVCLGRKDSISSLYISTMKNSEYNYTQQNVIYEEQL